MRKYIPNMITGLRIAGAAVLVFLEAPQLPFLTVYALCGLSDMADGAIARKLETDGRTGAVFDSTSDLVFAAVCAVKLLPLIEPQIGLLIIICIIAVIKLASLATAFFKTGSFGFHHTAANRLTGLLLFFGLPLMAVYQANLIAVIICAAATFAAVQELWINITSDSTESQEV